MGLSIDLSTAKSYTSALNSYLTFCQIHGFDINPTPDTLSLFVAFMSEYVNPRSITTYLSGICHQLEPHFPDVRTARTSSLVVKSLRGAHRLRGSPIRRKYPVTTSQLQNIVYLLRQSHTHDNLLFISMLLTGFFGLLRLGELTVPDDRDLFDPKKLTLRSSVCKSEHSYQFQLPYHKADKLFEGNVVIIRMCTSTINPLPFFLQYIASRDSMFPLHTPLWITSEQKPPSRSWFLRHLHAFLGADFSGQSMRAGGATWLACLGTPPNLIQAAGRWSSLSWQIYVRKHPILIHSMLLPSNIS